MAALTPRMLKEFIDKMDEAQLDKEIIIYAEGEALADSVEIMPDGSLLISE